MASIAYAVNPATPASKDMQYLQPSARENTGTCIVVGVGMASFYNSGICFYYLSIVTYIMKDEYIKSKLEA